MIIAFVHIKCLKKTCLEFFIVNLKPGPKRGTYLKNRLGIDKGNNMFAYSFV